MSKLLIISVFGLLALAVGFAQASILSTNPVSTIDTTLPTGIDHPGIPNLHGEFTLPGTVRDTAKHFSITDSEYLNISIDSSEIIEAQIESVPHMILIHLEPSITAISSQITIKNLEPNTTHWWHQDTHRSSTPFTTDLTGSYTYTQDLTERHLVFIKPEPSTKYITDNATGGDCTTIGTWNSSTKTCTLTTNLTETIQIGASGITIDGANHTITGSYTGYGIFVNGYNNETIKNIDISRFSYGIYLNNSNNSSITNINIHNGIGIQIYNCSNCTLSNNTVSNSGPGIRLDYSNSNYLANNSATSGNWGIFLYSSNSNTLTSNTASNNYGYGIVLNSSINNTLNYNSTQDNRERDIWTDNCNNIIVNTTGSGNRPIKYFNGVVNLSNETLSQLILCNADGSNISNITIEGSSTWKNNGLYLLYTDNSTISNVNSSNNYNGIKLIYSNGNTIISSTANLNSAYGISLDTFNHNSTLIDNTANSNNYSGIFIYNSNNNTLTGNITSNNNTSNTGSGGVELAYSNNNTVTNNTISNNNGNGVGLRITNASNNQIYNNNFINNSTQVYIVNPGIYSTGNVFNSSLPLGGNYWSNYNCANSNSDGVCNSYYSFSGGQDNFPWIAPDLWPEPRNPVIIVPGIMGSYLNRVSDNAEVWPDFLNMANPFNDGDAYLSDLILSNSGNEEEGLEMFVSGIIETAPFRTIYGNLIDLFTNNGYTENENLFIMPYDWRLDIEDNLDLIIDTVSDAFDNSPTGKVDIVAHSTGGLLVKTYLLQQEDTSYIDKVIFVGVPQIGAPKTFKALNHGDNMDNPILNSARVKIITRNMPGVYQLLPSREYFNLTGGYVYDMRNGVDLLSYDETNDFMVEDENDDRNEYLLDQADLFHQELDAYTPNVDIYNIVGCANWDTIGEFYIKNGNKHDLKTTNGDKTVPLLSAVFNSGAFNNYFAPNIDHLELVVNNIPLNLIRNILINNSSNIPTSISNSSSTCFGGSPKMKRYSAHSPVELHLYDSNNNHTGPDDNGDTELAIPGSTYEILGEDKFIYVPDGDYRVEIKATDTGSFDFIVQELTQSLVTKTITYENIAIDDAALTAELDFGATDTTQLQIDEDGDETIDQNISPTSVDIPTPDTTVPTTTTVISGTAGDNGWYVSDVTLSISATDNSGGVGLDVTEYSRDNGTTWNIYTTPPKPSTDGNHDILYRSRDKAGNIEQPHSASVMIDKTVPFTSILVSGISGNNNWYTSNVTFALSASDSTSGIYTIKYSLDNGNTWSVYASPVMISTEGINTIQYYSEDSAGNTEITKAKVIKIDKTNPEAEIYLDIPTEQIKVFGTDNLTTPTIIENPQYLYTITDESSRSISIELESTIDLNPTTGVYTFNGKIVDIQYNGVSVPIPNNFITYSWVNQSGIITTLEQDIYVENSFKVTTAYNNITDSTDIVVENSSGMNTYNLPGLVIIRLETNDGVLEYSY
ncbi:MAG: hypothetical protein A3B23_01445 [Candidatus Colwellbacteria bacterium RIFCSPLOWO2_01_FULL_48_10]|uniref:Periplasmic copper-binding protein NosD beta helix domain-containing protein n=2 Tax=Bacteria candidate phyla TaxID=1783234 RepID=A0A1F5P4L3_9BACT|nr:MAG: hypothetical protein A2846_04260 [Candidatus Doudnabacteria bacterium RIFCSPHIGHO2_01_FULL_49_9]OGY59076.1 MAG: hypothetical protein A3B23_01445 [Candidatus Colwellbacteria bacterium RIFCSPLOWO2_01_FULL_48_10]